MKEECQTWDGKQNQGAPFECLLCDKTVESGETHGTKDCIDILSHGWAKACTERDRYLTALRRTIDHLCSCGGKGPNDEGVCSACALWHETQNPNKVQEGK